MTTKQFSRHITATLKALLIVLSLAAIAAAKDSEAVNMAVVTFARNNLGKTVNNGNCWVLPRDALLQANARFPGPRGSYPTTVFGRPIPAHQLVPGDILHFQNARFAKNNRVYFSTGTHHYAIVERVSRNQIFLFHQNSSGRRYVVRGCVSVSDLVSGTMVFYRPQAKR